MKRQQIDNQKGEVQFRRKLYQQQVEGRRVLEDENDAGSIENILGERMNVTLEQMRSLKRRNFPMTPYLELGAERCQRSLIMENDIAVHGAAVDLSFEMLKSCDHYSNVFKKSGIPLRICCDANNLPFLTGSIPFVFCYEFLHHFPEPLPVVKEIRRVLSPGGYLYFDEEPYRRVLHFPLYRRKKSYSDSAQSRGTVRRALDFFFCDEQCNEVAHGIIENLTIPLSAWNQALDLFEGCEARLKSIRGINSALRPPGSYANYLLAYLLGGSISALCRKTGTADSRFEPIERSLICPSCRERGMEVPLGSEAGSFGCSQCRSTYPVVDGVIFLLTPDKRAELYPEVSGSL